MSFDPYQYWLQIPPDRLPPTRYALLGLPEGETDLVRIQQSAAERDEHVRKYILGPYAEAAQQILTELSRAVTELTASVRRDSRDAIPTDFRRTLLAPLLEGDRIFRAGARPIIDQPSGGTWPTAFRDWLGESREPEDVFHLLGRLRFDPDREALLVDIRAALEVLAPYEDQSEADDLDHASKLKKLLLYAEEVFSDPRRMEIYYTMIRKRIRQALGEAQTASGRSWSPDEVLGWLEREQWVHPYALTMVARDVLD